MRFDIITLFPELFETWLSKGITRRAYQSNQVEVQLHNPRDHAEGNYRRVDDRPFGGGPGMVMLAEPLLRATLTRLPGRKFVFSNAPVHYAQAVLRALGIIDLFSDVYTIEHTRYRPKPDTFGFLRLCRSHHLRPRRCIMVEDNLDNLRTAKRLGMKTVWVSAAGTLRGRTPAYVDQTVRSVASLPGRLAWLQ